MSVHPALIWIWLYGIFLGTTLYSWETENQDISYGRLGSKGYDTDPTE